MLISVLGWAAGAAAQVTTQPDDRAAALPANDDVNDGTDNTDVGLIQVELGGQFTRAASTSRSGGTPFSLRYGAVEWLELSLGADGYVRQQIGGSTGSGFGDLALGAKVRLFGAPGGAPVVSLLPQLVLPTADVEAGLGSGSADVMLGLLTGRDLRRRSHVDASYGIAAIGKGDGLGRFAQHLAFVSGSLGVTAAWTPSLTVTWISRQDAVTGRAAVLTAGSVVTVSRRLAWDASAQFGLSREAPALALAGGLSFVIGELSLDRGVHARRHRLRLPSRRRTARPAARG